MDTNILLENGTNELEVLEFTLAGNHYGINVAKIREILTYQPVTPIPNAHPSVEGIFMPRDTMITVINLRNCLGIPKMEKDGLFIITNFNKLNIAFHVDEVCGIHRLSWADIIKPDSTINVEESGVSTGVIKLEDRLIVILDFEKIVTDISPETGLQVSDMAEIGERDRSESPIVIAEDSPLLSKLITDCLKKAGYTHLVVCADGEEAWDKLCEFRDGGNLDSKVHLIITDIEMPRMDGYTLAGEIRKYSKYRNLPLIAVTSRTSKTDRLRGVEVGMTEYITKPYSPEYLENVVRKNLKLG